MPPLHQYNRFLRAGHPQTWDLDRLGADQRAALEYMAGVTILDAQKQGKDVVAVGESMVPLANPDLLAATVESLLRLIRETRRAAEKTTFLETAQKFAKSPRLADDGFGFIRNILDVSGASAGGNSGAAFCNFASCRTALHRQTRVHPVRYGWYSYAFDLQKHGAPKMTARKDYVVFKIDRFARVPIEDWHAHHKPRFLEKAISEYHAHVHFPPSVRFEVIALTVTHKEQKEWSHQVVLILDYRENSYTFYDSSLWTREHVRNHLPHVLHVKGLSKGAGGARTNHTLYYKREPFHFPLQHFEGETTARLGGSCVFVSLFVGLACVAVGVNAPEAISVVIYELANRSPERIEYGIRRFTEMIIRSEVTHTVVPAGDGTFRRRCLSPDEARVPLGPNASPVTRNLARSSFPEAGLGWLERALQNERASTTPTTRAMKRRKQVANSLFSRPLL